MLEINISPRFKRSYKKLPHHLKDDFDSKITIFAEEPNHASLKTHKLNGRIQNCLSFYLKEGYRVLFEFRNSNAVDLLDVGPHDKYRKWPK